MSIYLHLQIVASLLAKIEQLKNPNRLLREAEAAARLNVSPRTLARWREDRVIGCIQAKEGMTVLYKPEHIEEFLQRSEVRPKVRSRRPRILPADIE